MNEPVPAVPLHAPPEDPNDAAWDGTLIADPMFFAFPIMPRERIGPDQISMDVDEIGTAFFVSAGSDGALFLTAKHLVDKYWGKHRMQVLFFDESQTIFYPLEVLAIDMHPTADFAIGAARLPPVEVKALRLGFGRLDPNERVAAWGYASTQHNEREDGGPLPGLQVEFNPRFYKGRVLQFLDNQPSGPGYAHDGQSRGGVSGGPLIRVEDWGVYGVNSRGMNGVYERAVSIGHVADWQASILGGKSLRDLANEGTIYTVS